MHPCGIWTKNPDPWADAGRAAAALLAGAESDGEFMALSAKPLPGRPGVPRLRPLTGRRDAGVSFADQGGREVRLPMRLHQRRAREVITIRINRWASEVAADITT
jgi:hypothetical protein